MDDVKKLLQKSFERLRNAHPSAKWDVDIQLVDLETARANGHVPEEDAEDGESSGQSSDNKLFVQTVWRGRKPAGNQWSLYDAIFYAQTIVTTVGKPPSIRFAL